MFAGLVLPLLMLRSSGNSSCRRDHLPCRPEGYSGRLAHSKGTRTARLRRDDEHSAVRTRIDLLMGFVMKELFQADDRRVPWLSHADGRLALIASTLGGHDEGHRAGNRLYARLKTAMLAVSGRPSELSTGAVLHAVKSSFAGHAEVEGWALNLGLVISTERSWRVWTIGLVCCGQWSPGRWTWLTRPQSVARELERQGVVDTTGFGQYAAAKLAHLGMKSDDFEVAQVAKAPETAIVLVGSASAGRQLEAASEDESWNIGLVGNVLDRTRPRTPGVGASTTTFAVLR